MPFDDPLIDLDIKDIVDIVRVYSLFSKSNEQEKLFVPQLFSDESTDQLPEEVPKQEELSLQSFDNILIPESL